MFVLSRGGKPFSSSVRARAFNERKKIAGAEYFSAADRPRGAGAGARRSFSLVKSGKLQEAVSNGSIVP